MLSPHKDSITNVSVCVCVCDALKIPMLVVWGKKICSMYLRPPAFGFVCFDFCLLILYRDFKECTWETSVERLF